MQVADRIERISEQYINFFLVEEAGRVLVVDSGMPGNWGLLLAGLGRIGRTLPDVEAVLLSHAHSDHVGLAERLRREAPAPVRIHADDLPFLLAGSRPPGSRPAGVSRTLLGVLVYALRKGGTKVPPVAEATAFAHGDILDLPGSPQVVFTPGHSPGHCAFHLPSRDALIVGDAISTWSPLTGARGPQLSPFQTDVEQTISSLTLLEELPASIVLPGHGEPFAGTPAEAVRLARAAGIRR